MPRGNQEQQRERVPVPVRREATQQQQPMPRYYDNEPRMPQRELDEMEFWYTPVLNRLDQFLADEFVTTSAQVSALVNKWLNGTPDGYRALMVMTEVEVRQHQFKKVDSRLRSAVTQVLLSNKLR